MGRFNPFFCTTERSRRVSISLFILALLSWVTWLGIVSDGFSKRMHEDDWYIVLGVPVVAYAAFLAFWQIHLRGSRIVRFVFSLNLMWAFLLGGWGYVWEWESHFSFQQYLGLFIFPLLGTWLAFILWSWSKSAPAGTTTDMKVLYEKEHKKDVQADIVQNENANSQPGWEKWRKPLYWAVGILIIVLGMSQASSADLFISFIFTWTVILTPPAVVRFILVRKPIASMNVAAAISGVLYFFNLMLFIALGSQNKSHTVLILGAIACYNLLKYETKEQTKTRLLEERKRLGYD
jgi:hypothetical protein